jgi:hypothetical protein
MVLVFCLEQLLADVKKELLGRWHCWQTNILSRREVPHVIM